jgi:hypothetical protein
MFSVLVKKNILQRCNQSSKGIVYYVTGDNFHSFISKPNMICVQEIKNEKGFGKIKKESLILHEIQVTDNHSLLKKLFEVRSQFNGSLSKSENSLCLDNLIQPCLLSHIK